MKTKPLILCILSGFIPMAHGAAGIYDGLVWSTTTTPFAFGSATFYEIDSSTVGLFGAAEFDGADLGTYTIGDTLYLTGEQKSFKNNGTDVTAHTLFWSLDGGSSSTSFGYGFEADLGGGDQRWGQANAGNVTGNVLDGLGAGSYTLSIWSTINTNGTDAAPVITNDNGGSNFNATFTVIPEPSTALLGLLGSAFLLRRRR